jgi:hypothetical protein
MPLVRLARLAGALVAVLVLSGCATVVFSLPAVVDPPGRGAEEAPVSGAQGSDVDRLAQAALADLEAYWAEQFPQVFGQEFTPLRGGYFSVDPDDVDPRDFPDGVGCGADPLEAENNAFYCPGPSSPTCPRSTAGSSRPW